MPSHRPGSTLWPAATAPSLPVFTNGDDQAVAVPRPAPPRPRSRSTAGVLVRKDGRRCGGASCGSGECAGSHRDGQNGQQADAEGNERQRRRSGPMARARDSHATAWRAAACRSRRRRRARQLGSWSACSSASARFIRRLAIWRAFCPAALDDATAGSIPRMSSRTLRFSSHVKARPVQ